MASEEQVSAAVQAVIDDFRSWPLAPIMHYPDEVDLEYEDVFFPSEDGVGLEGWFIPCKGSKKVIIANHPHWFNRAGLPSHLEPWKSLMPGGDFEVNFIPDYKILHDAGYNVLAYDLRNHGLSGSGNNGLFGFFEWRDVLGSLKYIRNRPDTSDMTIGLFMIPLKEFQSKTVDTITDEIIDVLGNDDQEIIWHNHDYCRTFFSTQGGGNCETRTYDRGSKERTATHKDSDCSWIDPPNNDPPVVYYEGDQGIGTYSIQYTATKEHAWGGIPGTSTCAVQGLCNPQYVFYRGGYNLVLNTWESQGEISFCQYSGGANCRGLCKSKVMDQFGQGGHTWGGDCAIPCGGDADLPAVEIDIGTGIFD
ncbi:hypothetical protein NM208_g4400 [Fusarium decemcellulare]|uniref:Uncharacterized protein n=1 Tax=Fusarium decemcellulare TaxID=57161 RepID=A0ACC1SKX1_9HYPO|nr:hypothetical protein NM208_g4400 [Fusarium decemcellulare]